MECERSHSKATAEPGAKPVAQMLLSATLVPASEIAGVVLEQLTQTEA